MRLFESPSVITDPVGNNRFGQPETGPALPIEVPKRVYGGFPDVRLGSRIAFREADSSGRITEEFGLENFVSTEWEGVPFHIVDNHNYALAFWLEAYAEGRIGKGATLVHVDMHSDLWKNGYSLDLERAADPSYVEDFVNRKTEVGNYIDPAVRAGLVGEVAKIEGEGELEAALERLEEWGVGRFGTFPATHSLILNLDLDFFAPDLDYIPFELKKRAVLGFARRARLVTVATSPCFIDQELALRKFYELFGRT